MCITEKQLLNFFRLAQEGNFKDSFLSLCEHTGIDAAAMESHLLKEMGVSGEEYLRKCRESAGEV